MQEIEAKVKAALPGSSVVAKKFGHPGDHGLPHVSIEVTYAGFKGKSLVEQHQMIYSALEEEMKNSIHALKIKTIIPEENNG
jgi:stress-induced morphogen